MTQRVNTLSETAALEAEITDLAEKVRASVVQVQGSHSGSGSGVVWSADGLIVTNQHVVPGGDRAAVDFADGRRLAARVIGRAPNADLAALRIEDLPADWQPTPARSAGRRSVRPGELVLAVGNPLGERGAATLGAVSGRGTFGSRTGAWDVLRVSILVRPGNSGGALADVQGQILGLPFMITGSRQALAVPADVVDDFLATIDAAAPVTAANRLGIAAQIVRLAPAQATRCGLPEAGGLLVLAVEPGSPADRAGLRLGDVVPTTAAGSADEIGRAAEATLRQALIEGTRSLTVLRGLDLIEVLAERRAA